MVTGVQTCALPIYFASIGIIIGGLGSICPERRADIIDMGYKSLVAGTLATLSCGALVGIMY